MRLFRTELYRFWTRRNTWVVLGLAAAVMVLSVGIAYTRTSADAPAAEVNSTTWDEFCVIAQLEAYNSDTLPAELQAMSPVEFENFARNEMCFIFSETADDRFFATSMLSSSFTPTADWSTHRENPEPGFTQIIDGVEYRQARFGLDGILPGVATFFLVLAVVLGGSFMGAEYRAGTVENLLLWEPRRSRVLITKFAAGFLSAMIVTALALVFLTGLLSLLASTHGSWRGVDSRFWIDVLSVIFRSSLTGGMFFVLSMAVATITKHTAAAIAAVLGWFAVSNVVIELVAKPVRQYELFTNSVSFQAEAEMFKYVKAPDGWDFQAFAHGYLTAGLIVALWAFVPALIAVVVFQRRDIS